MPGLQELEEKEPDTKDKPTTKEAPKSDTTRNLAGIPIVKVSKPAEYLNILIYGEPGVGKTVLAGSASAVEAMSPVLLIDVEGGSLSLRERYPTIDVARVESYQQVRELGAHLRKEKGAGYKTVILDSLSETTKISMVTIMEAVVLENPDRDKDVPAIRDWGKNMEQVRRLVRFFRDLPVNTIFTCHEQEQTDERTKMTKTKPSLSGKLSNEVAGFVDEVWYLYTKIVNNEAKRLLLTGPEGSKIAKDRSDKLPLIIPEPEMSIIYNAIYNDKAITQ